MSRIAKLCSFCGAKVPPELLLGPAEKAAVERAEAASRRMIELKYDVPGGLAGSIIPPPTKQPPRPPFRPVTPPRVFPRERIAAFCDLIQLAASHPEYDRWVTAEGMEESSWEIVLSESPNYFTIDWRAALEAEFTDILARLGELGVSITAEFSPDGDRATLTRAGATCIAKYRPVDNDTFDAPVAALNTLLRGHSQLRADRTFEGSDGFGYLLLSEGDWRRVETEFPEFAPYFYLPQPRPPEGGSKLET